MPKPRRAGTQTIIRRTVIILFIGLSLGSIALFNFLDTRYSETRPNSPRPEEGRIYAQHVYHGTLVYLTQMEKLAYQFTPALCVAFGGLAIYLHRRGSRSPS